MLSQADVSQYLLDRGLLGPDAIVDGDLAIRDASSRNSNLRVETRRGPSFFLKQGIGPDGRATVTNEAAAYSRLWAEPELQEFLPRFHGFDSEIGVLVTELVQGGENLRSHHAGSGQFSASHGAGLGAALGNLHRLTRTDAEPTPLAAAWVLRLHRPHVSIMRDISAAGLELLAVLQGAGSLGEAFDEMRVTWRPEALIHGDVKWDNCLVVEADGHGEGLKIVDWESAQLGDPAWDLGSALSQYLSFWIFSIPVTGSVPPDRFPELAAYPLDSMKSAITACWLAYESALEGDAGQSTARLLRAVRLSGARLVQTAFEAAQLMQQLTSAVVLHLQLADNIVARPEEAAARLMGLPLLRTGRP